MPDYSEIYFHNRYEIDLGNATTFSFSFQDLTEHPIFDRPFSIITAFNPENKTYSRHENRLRNQKLYNELNSKYELLKVTGCYKEHCEESFLIFDISLSESRALGLKYAQYAIFYNGVDLLQYIECENESVIVEKVR